MWGYCGDMFYLYCRVNLFNMATINYLIRGNKQETNILLRFKNGRKCDLTASTDLKVNPKNWSKAKQKVKLTADDSTKDFVNGKLLELKKYIFDQFNEDNSVGEIIDSQWVKKVIADFFKRPTDINAIDKFYFTPYVEIFIKNAPNRILKSKNRAVSKGTITKYKTTLKKLQEYEERFKTKIKFTDLDLIFYEKYVNFLSKEQRINLGTIGNYIGTIKTIARDAKLKDLPVHKHIEHPNFFVPKVTSDDIYLKEEEIDIIFNYDFKGVERLENARDLFIIGLRTGLRVSDFLKLKLDNIVDGYIEIESKKTDYFTTIPLHPQVMSILNKRGGQFPRMISDQKFNLHIKELCKVVGFTELTEGSKMNNKTKRKEKGIYPKYKLVTSHICRRSFASNLYGKLDNLTIMAITGHKTETQFLKYIKITDTEKAEKLKDFWDKQITDNEDVVVK